MRDFATAATLAMMRLHSISTRKTCHLTTLSFHPRKQPGDARKSDPANEDPAKAARDPDRGLRRHPHTGPAKKVCATTCPEPPAIGVFSRHIAGLQIACALIEQPREPPNRQARHREPPNCLQHFHRTLARFGQKKETASLRQSSRNAVSPRQGSLPLPPASAAV